MIVFRKKFLSLITVVSNKGSREGGFGKKIGFQLNNANPLRHHVRRKHCDCERYRDGRRGREEDGPKSSLLTKKTSL